MQVKPTMWDHKSEWLNLKTMRTSNAGKDAKKLNDSYFAVKYVKQFIYPAKPFGSFLKRKNKAYNYMILQLPCGHLF